MKTNFIRSKDVLQGLYTTYPHLCRDRSIDLSSHETNRHTKLRMDGKYVMRYGCRNFAENKARVKDICDQGKAITESYKKIYAGNIIAWTHLKQGGKKWMMWLWSTESSKSAGLVILQG